MSSNKINRRSQVQVSCCHGDVRSYPTANVRVTIDGKTHHVKAEVLAQLRQPVLLSQDVLMLRKLVQDKVSACLVLTRAEREKAEQEDERLLRASQQSGGSPSPIVSDDDAEFQRLAVGLDEGLFQAGGKVRKNRKQRQLAKRTFTLFADQANSDTQAVELESSAGLPLLRILP